MAAATAFLCAALTPAAAQRTSTLGGVVTRSGDGELLPGVVVVVAATGLRTSTDVNGRFLLERVTAGRITVRFRQIGYAPSDLVLDVPSDSAVTLDATLVPRPIELGALIVEGASRAPETVLEAPAAVTVIDPGAKRAASLAGQPPVALATVPGLDIVQSGVNDFNVNARGFNSTLARSMLVLQDGRDVSVPFLGSQEWAALPQPADEIERIEVVRGPGSALYGANAFSGVITLTTPAVRDAVGNRVSLGGGELGTWRTDARHAAVFGAGRFGYRVNLGYTRSDSWTRSRTRLDGQDFVAEYRPVTDSTVNPPLPGFELQPLNGQTKDAVTGQAVGDRRPLQSVYGSGRLDHYADNGAVLTAEGGAAQTQNETFVTGIGRVQVVKALRPWARVAWATDAVNLMAWYSGRTAQKPMVLLSSGRPIRDESAVFHVEGQYRRRLAGERGRVILGASARDARVDTKNTLIGPQDDDRSDAYYSAYAQLEYAVLSTIRLIGATRYDRSDLFAAELSPKAAIVFSPSPRQAVRLSVNRAFLTPSQIEFFLNIQPAAQNLLPLETALRASP
ncbi:MAG: TonB-dependent receptor, partial [Candidatus Rokuibacteriota bacterium]